MTPRSFFVEARVTRVYMTRRERPIPRDDATTTTTMTTTTTTTTTERQRQVARLRAALSDLKCWGVGDSYRKGKKIMQKACDGEKQRIVHAGGASTKYETADPKKTAAVRRMHKCDGERAPKRGTARHLACEYLWKVKPS